MGATLACIKGTAKCIEITPKAIFAGCLALYDIYTLCESRAFFKEHKLFGGISDIVYFVIEIILAIMILLVAFIKKKCYTFILFIITLPLAVMALIYDSAKVFWFNNKINNAKIDHKIIQFLFVYRAIADVIIKAIICKFCYDYKNDAKTGKLTDPLTKLNNFK